MAKFIFVLTLAVLAGVASWNLAFADSCPYCGKRYGEGAPGDEAYIADIRARHEAVCEKRPGAQPPTTQPGERQPAYDEAWWIAQQQEMARIERILQEEKRIRKERLEREARERAEAQARRLEFEQSKQRMLFMMKGASSSLGLKSAAGGEAVELRPKGTEMFNIPLQGGEGQPGIQTQKIGQARLLPSSSELENIRCAMWLYQKSAQAANEEEAHFLAQQADEALQGHPLRVEVPSAERTPNLTPERLTEFKELAANIEVNQQNYTEASRDLRLAEDRANVYKIRVETLQSSLNALGQNPAKTQPQGTPAPAPNPTPQVEPKPPAGQQKQREDLLKQLEELRRQMQENEKTLAGLKTRQEQTQNELQKSQKRLDGFKHGVK